MSLYKCECGKQEKYLGKVTLKYIDGKFRAVEALCECGKYMDSKPLEGMPQIIRTEDSLNKNAKREKLWDSAKEKLIGERGVNDNYK